MPATKHQLTASLPLQIMIYYNIILSVIYFCFAGVGTYNKMNGNYQSIKPYEVSLCFLSLSSFKKVLKKEVRKLNPNPEINTIISIC